MDQDIYLVIGIIVLGLALPSAFGAMADRRSPRAAAIVILIGGGLVAIAVSQKPGGYTLDDIPRAFVNVTAEVLRMF